MRYCVYLTPIKVYQRVWTVDILEQNTFLDNKSKFKESYKQ